VHHKVVEAFVNHIQKMGLEATVKTESELVADHVQGQDLIISLGKHSLLTYLAGGDSTYLKTAGMIDNCA
jgi:hypothetical protein